MRMFLIAALLFVAACTGKPGSDDPALSGRQLNLEEFFEGDLIAYGQFQDVLGTVRRRFEVTITGRWDGQTLRLVEDFTYEDASTEQRIWTLIKTGPQTWEGSAPGVQGKAMGTERGDTFNWVYTIDLPLGDGTTTRFSFDDWMWLLSEDRLLNRAYMTRAGVYVGDVIITFEKL